MIFFLHIWRHIQMPHFYHNSQTGLVIQNVTLHLTGKPSKKNTLAYSAHYKITKKMNTDVNTGWCFPGEECWASIDVNIPHPLLSCFRFKTSSNSSWPHLGPGLLYGSLLQLPVVEAASPIVLLSPHEEDNRECLSKVYLILVFK